MPNIVEMSQCDGCFDAMGIERLGVKFRSSSSARFLGRVACLADKSVELFYLLWCCLVTEEICPLGVAIIHEEVLVELGDVYFRPLFVIGADGSV